VIVIWKVCSFHKVWYFYDDWFGSFSGFYTEVLLHNFALEITARKKIELFTTNIAWMNEMKPFLELSRAIREGFSGLCLFLSTFYASTVCTQLLCKCNTLDQLFRTFWACKWETETKCTIVPRGEHLSFYSWCTIGKQKCGVFNTWLWKFRNLPWERLPLLIANCEWHLCYKSYANSERIGVCNNNTTFIFSWNKGQIPLSNCTLFKLYLVFTLPSRY